MSIVKMDMSSYEVERYDPIVCRDECSDCMPALALQQYIDTRHTLPVDMTTLDAESFLQKMYAYPL